jgi:type II secretory pathway pseudopilin PulG
MQLVDEYADSIGVMPSIVRSDDQVQEIQQQEQQQQAQAQAMESGATLAKTAKDASAAKIEDDNALGIMMNQAGLA